MPNEDEISIDANSDDDVRSVRDRILARVPIPPDQLCLVYNQYNGKNSTTDVLWSTTTLGMDQSST